MPASQRHIDDGTPLGATVLPDGATFRVWAPDALAVYVLTGATQDVGQPGWQPADEAALVRQDDGTWTGFVADIGDGARYRFWVVGTGSNGVKRDPHARELGVDPPFPSCDCIVRDATSYPWHDHAWRPPPFHELVIYQLHVGVFHARDADGSDARLRRPGRFLDLLDRIDYLRDLGVNAIQPLPVQEYPSEFSMGYNGTDYFSPETDYQVTDEAELRRWLERANALLARGFHQPLELEQLRPGINQLKAVIDLCHLNGIAVLLDLVYNHAGGGFDEASMYFMDRRPHGDNNDSLYFTDRGWAGGLVFAYWNPGVRRFLIDNARFFLDEYHVDGFRYDEISVADHHGGWWFCQDLARDVRAARPEAVQIAEYWNDWRWLAVVPPAEGMGFDAALADGLRDAVRGALQQASGGRHAAVTLDPVHTALGRPHRFPDAWRAVQCVENHDIVYADRPPHERFPRVAALADPSDARSWYARSRARVATGLLLTAPGIPMLFMGQELLEPRNWSDNPRHSRDTLVDWRAAETDRAARDHHAFTRALIALRRRLPALTGERVHAYHSHDGTRVLAFHRWLDGSGEDVVVVASLNEDTFWSYELGFPLPGRWREAFNSDFFDGLPNPSTLGNGGSVLADGPPRHGLPHSATLVIPANGLLVFTREA